MGGKKIKEVKKKKIPITYIEARKEKNDGCLNSTH